MKIKNNPQRKKVLVAMSGGVDSSVAALLMKQKGYEVVGAFMKNWSDTKNIKGECNWKDERRMAIKVASILNIPLKTFDFEKEYKKLVIEEMFKKYKRGITPNPDIDCNEKVKFPLLIKAAEKENANYVVTGHFARIKKTSKLNLKTPGAGGRGTEHSNKNGGTKNVFELHRAKDEMKDQSYFLYRLNQKDLSKTLFPIGELSKEKTREIAKQNKFPNFDKKSTVGICFIGKVNLKDFLKQKIKPKKGKILDPEGKIIGEHDGIFYYTIGQRIGPRFGINISNEAKKREMKKWYVAKKDSKKNTITAAPEGHKINFKDEVEITDFYLIDEDKKEFLKKIKNKPEKLNVRIRQVGELIPSKIFIEKNKIFAKFNKPLFGVSEGQAIVLYKGTKTLGGGVISF